MKRTTITMVKSAASFFGIAIVLFALALLNKKISECLLLLSLLGIVSFFVVLIHAKFSVKDRMLEEKRYYDFFTSGWSWPEELTFYERRRIKRFWFIFLMSLVTLTFIFYKNKG